MKRFERVIECYIIGIVLLYLIVVLSSCRTRTITLTETKEVPVVATNTITNERVTIVRDTLHQLDSVFVYVKGDTLVEKHYNTIYKNVGYRDTIRIIDSIPKIVTVTNTKTETKEVEKSKSWLEKTNEYAGTIVILALLGFVGFKIYRRFFS